MDILTNGTGNSTSSPTFSDGNTRTSTTDIILTLLYVSIILLHSLGSYLQIRLFREGKDSVQLIYLINLGLTEALGCTLGLFFLRLPIVFGVHPKDITYRAIKKYIYIVLYSLPLIYYTNFIYIAVDKALYILLGIKYHLYCTQKRAIRLLVVTWLTSACLCVTMSLVTYFSEREYYEEFSKYFNPTLDFLFLGTAILCYGAIFREYKKTRSSPVPLSNNNNGQRRKKESTFKVFRNSRFYVSGLLILTFLMLVVIPDIVYLFHFHIGRNRSELFDAIVLIFFLLSYFNDAFIYIFMQPDVRKLLKKVVLQHMSTA